MSILLLGAPLIIGVIFAPHLANAFLNPNSYQDGYNYGIDEWNHYASDLTHHFECPLSQTDPHSNFCAGYDSAISYEVSDQ